MTELQQQALWVALGMLVIPTLWLSIRWQMSPDKDPDGNLSFVDTGMGVIGVVTFVVGFSVCLVLAFFQVGYSVLSWIQENFSFLGPVVGALLAIFTLILGISFVADRQTKKHLRSKK